MVCIAYSKIPLARFLQCHPRTDFTLSFCYLLRRDLGIFAVGYSFVFLCCLLMTIRHTQSMDDQSAMTNIKPCCRTIIARATVPRKELGARCGESVIALVLVKLLRVYERSTSPHDIQTM